MKLTGTKQRLCLSGWILAGVLLASFNGFQLFAMEHQALTGYSPAIKSLQQKLRQLEGTFAGEALAVQAAALAPLFDRYQKPQAPAAALPEVRPDTQIRPADSPTSALPRLTGTVRMWHPEGGTEHLAVIEGRRYRSADTIGEFVVGRIAETGVMLHRAGKQFFLDAPRPHFSTDQGE